MENKGRTEKEKGVITIAIRAAELCNTGDVNLAAALVCSLGAASSAMAVLLTRDRIKSSRIMSDFYDAIWRIVNS